MHQASYANTHVYWSVGVFLYFVVGATMSSLILSDVHISSTLYHIFVILYTIVGFIVITCWVYWYLSYKTSKCIFGSTSITVSPDKDTEYGVVHALYIESSLISLIVVFIFWIWFLIYFSAVKVKDIDEVLQVYACILLPFTFLIAIFFLASWWIPKGSRTLCSHQRIHLSSCDKNYMEKHTDIQLHW